MKEKKKLIENENDKGEKATQKADPKTVSISGNDVAPFGYHWSDGSLVQNETESPIRKLMYELFLKHRRKKTVARLLNDAGYRTRTGALFSDMTVDRLLRDSSAKGIYQTKQGKKPGEIKRTVEIQIEPIVSIELWDQAYCK